MSYSCIVASGFLVTGAAVAYFIHRDLARDRYLLLAQLNDNFGALETRVSNLESVPQDSSIQQPMGPSVSQNGGSSSGVVSSKFCIIATPLTDSLCCTEVCYEE